MVLAIGMETYTARLVSFNVAHPATKKRASNAANAKTLRWPHKSPTPVQLARAGFFYRPTTSCPDNTACFLCQKDLDGWESDDNAITEHLRLSPDCGWAITVCVEQDIEDGIRDMDDPMSAKMLEARRTTFGAAWPHEGKRGWTCRTQKMIEAGWYYSPTEESDDFVKCPYCSLSLDGWEPKDNPFDEHQRRSPECFFFNSLVSIKPLRSKKGRGSKASRISTQSNCTTVSEAPSMTELGSDPVDIEPVSTVSDVASSVRERKVGKKAGGIKKGFTRSKTKSTKERAEESVQASSFTEPEDDDFEVKFTTDLALSAAKSTRGKKRKSDGSVEANVASPMHMIQAESTREPAPKRRNTRTRGSAIAQATAMLTPPTELDSDTHMTDTATMPPPKATISKKRGRKPKQNSSSVMRHTSNISTASTASLRATIPNDEQIEAALKAELDKPFTDDEMDIQPEDEIRPEVRRLTRTNPDSRNVTASLAPVRRITRTSVMTTDPHIRQESLEPLKQAPKPTKSKGGRLKSKTKNASSSAGVVQQLPHPTVFPSETPSTPRPYESLQQSHPPSGAAPTAPATVHSTPDTPRRPVSLQQSHPPSRAPATVQTTAHSTPAKAISPQSSDAENHPPSSRPSTKRPPLALLSPSRSNQPVHNPLVSTPTTSPLKRNIAKLQTTFPWTSVDIETVFCGLSDFGRGYDQSKAMSGLSLGEKKMSVEEWMKWNAPIAEERLRGKCEALVGAFEKEGGRAMRCLEGVRCVD